METPKSATTPDKKSVSKFDAILEQISDHLIWFVAAAAVIVILLVIFLLVSVVKLHNRNRELDDLYDEYELDDEPQRNPVKPIQPVKAEKKSQFKKRQDDDFEDDYDDFDDDFDDDDYYDDDFDDDYDDEGIVRFKDSEQLIRTKKKSPETLTAVKSCPTKALICEV